MGDVRVEFEVLLPEDWEPSQIAFRVGRAEDHHTPRRSREEVLR